MVSRPAGRRVTVRDIAAQTGVSIATVSRVLNGRDHVAPQTRDLVRAAAEQLQAVPARAATGAVYLRCPYLLTDYFGLIVSAVAETLALHGRAVVLDAGTAAQQATVLPSLPGRPGPAPPWTAIVMPATGSPPPASPHAGCGPTPRPPVQAILPTGVSGNTVQLRLQVCNFGVCLERDG